MKKRLIWLAPIVIVLAIIAGCAYYVLDAYEVTDKAKALNGNETVIIKETEWGYFYDGPGQENALIFYPGGKVEDLAYSNLLTDISTCGVDCFLVHMPCNFAFLGIDKADDIISEYSYESWYLAGHSLGGAMAAEYAKKHSNSLTGLIFLAAYSVQDLSDTDLKVLSLYGRNDGVLDREKLEISRGYMPKNFKEICIDGGNHAQFGSYGKQKGDLDATITEEEQQSQTVNAVLDYIYH